jgi:4-amino-4-deoxy-L-arabinose transferase-like glycosyltransferase
MLNSQPSVARFGAWLFVGVFAARAFTSTYAYFVDAPLHLGAIRDRTYVIQAPGYWLFNRTAGLFPDPEIAISVMNWLFSAGGAVFFYLVARKLASESVARISAIAYAAVFFAWFSGNIHSTYASQLLFPVSSFFFILQYQEERERRWLIWAAVAFALGAGFRPSDGAFFAPVFLYALTKAARKDAVISAATAFALCLAWLIPQQIALTHKTDPVNKSFENHLLQIANGPLASGFSLYALSNALRYFLPLTLALFPLFPLIYRARGKSFPLWLWIVPGSAFFLLVYVSDAPYLNWLVAPLLLLGVVSAEVPDGRKVRLFAFCAVVNLLFYFAWRPVALPDARLQKAEYVVEADLGKYTFYSVRNHRQLILSELLNRPLFHRH